MVIKHCHGNPNYKYFCTVSSNHYNTIQFLPFFVVDNDFHLLLLKNKNHTIKY